MRLDQVFLSWPRIISIKRRRIEIEGKKGGLLAALDHLDTLSGLLIILTSYGERTKKIGKAAKEEIREITSGNTSQQEWTLRNIPSSRAVFGDKRRKG
jgi:hypothetical protein